MRLETPNPLIRPPAPRPMTRSRPLRRTRPNLGKGPESTPKAGICAPRGEISSYFAYVFSNNSSGHWKSRRTTRHRVAERPVGSNRVWPTRGIRHRTSRRVARRNAFARSARGVIEPLPSPEQAGAGCFGRPFRNRLRIARASRPIGFAIDRTNVRSCSGRASTTCCASLLNVGKETS